MALFGPMKRDVEISKNSRAGRTGDEFAILGVACDWIRISRKLDGVDSIMIEDSNIINQSDDCYIVRVEWYETRKD